ncbi:MAG: BREX system P-loop protein BrxC [Cetobacterium sp.]
MISCKDTLCIKDTLKNDISRKINGVVKADKGQEKTVVTELSEYVVTEEVRKHLSRLFDRYVDSLQNETEDMGVWISGFFGSGKSHFLKMIGHIIENKEHGGKRATEYFKNKLNDSTLQSNLERASEKSTDVILFNIDNVSDQDTFQNKDAIVVAFLKKFNEHCGFSRDDIKVAEFERMVSKKGKFREFKEAFEEETGDTWEEGRRNIDFNGDEFLDVVEELDIMSRENAERWLEKESIKSISVESFCELLKEYLDMKDKNHRIVFLVDEIGQYIGDNSQLMLNLQTLIELLGVNFRGKVWVGVTSQQDLGAILDSNDRKRNDFSKIQDRFKTMLPLSSGNIDEVIKKRLLEKREIEGEDLENFYNKKRIDLENLIYFEKKGITLKLYDNKEDFSGTYPFIGYQFNLLQTVFEKVRSMGHSGQHMSRGERSLLSSFQEAGIRISEREVGALVPFNYFYESIEQFLEDNARRPIMHAKNEKGVDQFGLEVLKLLFLLKGVNGIEPNLNTLTSFMVDSVDCDRIELESNIKKALSKLQKEVLIQKDGDAYYFLTNEEQDINREIADEEIDLSSVYKSLDSYIFDDIYSKKSIIVEETGNKYTFSRRVDEYCVGRANEQLDIVVLTPSADEYNNISLLGMRDGYDLILKLPENQDEYLSEIRYSLKVEAYVKRKQRETTRELIAQILESKVRENSSRKRRIQNEIKLALESAEVYLEGHKIEIKSKDAERCIDESLRAAANNRFKNAKLIKKKYDEAKIRDVLATEFLSENQLFKIDNDMEQNINIEAINEVLNRVINIDKRGGTVTLKDLVDYFTVKPYGWDLFSVNGLVAELWIYKRINLEESKVLITHQKEVRENLTKSQTKILERLVITPKEEIDRELISKVNNVLKELWGTDVELKGDSPKEELFSIVEKKRNISILCKKECETKRYPGVKVLKSWIELLDEVVTLKGKPEKVLKEFLSMEDELFELSEKEATVQDFLKSSKREKFDITVKKLSEIDGLNDYLGELKETPSYSRLREIKEMELPYGFIREIDGLLDSLKNDEMKIVESEKLSLLELAEKAFRELQKSLRDREQLYKESQEKFEEFRREIEVIKDSSIFTKERRLNNMILDIEKEYRRVIKNRISTFEKETLNELENKDSVQDLMEKVHLTFDSLKGDANSVKIEDLEDLLIVAELDKEGFKNEASGKMVKKARVSMRKIVGKTKYNLVQESDVEEYINGLEKELEILKAKMLEAVKNNKIVDIS